MSGMSLKSPRTPMSREYTPSATVTLTQTSNQPYTRVSKYVTTPSGGGSGAFPPVVADPDGSIVYAPGTEPESFSRPDTPRVAAGGRPFPSRPKLNPNEPAIISWVAWVFNLAFLSFFTPVMKQTGAKSKLKLDHLFQLPEFLRPHSSDAAVRKYRQGTEASRDTLVWPLIYAFGPRYSIIVFFTCFSSALEIVSPMCLGKVLDCVNSETCTMSEGMWWGVALVVSNVVKGIVQSYVWFGLSVCYKTIKDGIVASIFRKSLRILNREQFTSGEILNYINTDADRVTSMVWNIRDMINLPFKVVLSCFALYSLLGWAMFSGVLALAIVAPATYFMSKKLEKFWDKAQEIADHRVRLVNEILSGIEIIKLFAWEKLMFKKVAGIRQSQMDVRLQSGIYDALFEAMWSTLVGMLLVIVFSTFTLTGGVLTTAKTFASLGVFLSLNGSFLSFPYAIVGFLQGRVSLRRLNTLMMAEELPPLEGVNSDEGVNDDVAGDLVLDNTEFSYCVKAKKGKSDVDPTAADRDDDYDSDSEGVTLELLAAAREAESVALDASVTIRQGTLSAVVGEVGSGKSTFLRALMGELRCRSGARTLPGKVAYVSQTAWIQSGTLRSNVLFGAEYDRDKYRSVIAACALLPDIQIMAEGDLTVIGERGVTLSGGQKQRVALARAVYADADVYLLDDPLSAVDSFCAARLFETIRTRLGGKTVVLVTHHLHVLPYVDTVYVMGGGRIVEQGSHAELVAAGGAFSDLLAKHLKHTNDDEDEQKEASLRESVGGSLDSAKSTATSATHADGDDSDDDEPAEMSWRVFNAFFTVGGWGKLSGAIGFMFLHRVLIWMADMLLATWSMDPNYEKHSLKGYLWGYFGVQLGASAFVTVACMFHQYHEQGAMKIIHTRLLEAVMRAPMAWFNITSSGKIISRFSHDMDVCDNQIEWRLREVFNCVSFIVILFFFLLYSAPISLLLSVPSAYAVYQVGIMFANASRDLSRLKIETEAPLATLTNETLVGASTIRAFGREEDFAIEFLARSEPKTMCLFNDEMVTRWSLIRMDLACGFVTLCCVSYGVYASNGVVAGPAIVLTITYGYLFTWAWTWSAECIAMLQGRMASFEKIRRFVQMPIQDYDVVGTSINAEERARAEAIMPLLNETQLTSVSTESRDQPFEDGSIVFDDAVLRYKPDAEPALRGVSFRVNEGEKVAVVGRSGAGKSSLAQVLFRLRELEAGKIVVGGVDVATLELPELRSRLAIIPQTATLFAGTIRSNLDPDGVYDDATLWDVLWRGSLDEYVRSLEGQLDSKVTENGGSMSVGQRQLLCLVRAMLKNSQFLVMDEATASCDVEADARIQSVVRSHFKDTTILTIAHRLNTVMDYDKILVMGDGRVLEYASPHELVNRPGSVFAAMVDETGASSAQHLRELAAAAAGNTF